MNRTKLFICAIAALFFVGSSSAATNVVLNKNVQLYGNFFYDINGPFNPHANENTIVDGIFLPRYNDWWVNTVWWMHFPNQGYNICPECNIQINLGGKYIIDSLIVQADNNEQYNIYYWNNEISDWSLAWNVPVSDGGYGMQTRPNPSDNTQVYTLPSPITTDKFKIVNSEGDGYYSISEVQAFGRLEDNGNGIPEFPTVALPIIAVIGLMFLFHRRKGNGGN